MTDAIAQWISAHRAEQVDFLSALVKAPSDNPPGDCAPHGDMAAALLGAMGFTVERHRVPEELCRANGMVSATNLVIRHRFGAGPVVALNAHGDVVPPGAGPDTPVRYLEPESLNPKRGKPDDVGSAEVYGLAGYVASGSSYIIRKARTLADTVKFGVLGAVIAGELIALFMLTGNIVNDTG